MKKQDFLKAVRRAAGKFRADKIVVATGTANLNGKGVVEIEDGRFKVHVILDDGEHPPEPPNGIISRKDFWTISGIIEDEIKFSIRDLPHNTSHNYNFGQPSRSSLDFRINRLDLIPMGMDCMTSQEVYELQQETGRRAGIIEPASLSRVVAEVAPAKKTIQVTFHAILPSFKLIDRNGGTNTTSKNDFLGENTQSKSDTFHGVMKKWKYGLVERDDDLHVYLTSDPDYISLGQDQDWLHFHSFLQALAFTHAQHAWPFSVEHRRDGKLVIDRVQLNDDVAHSPHAPFSEDLAFNNRVKHLSWKFEEVLEMAYTFFSSNTNVSKEIENILFIFRESSTKGIPTRITLLSLCSLLESLVRIIYEERIAPEKTLETAEFQLAKNEVCKQLKQKNQPSYQRLSGIMSNAEPVNIRMRFDAVTERLGLNPQEKGLDLHGEWKKFRSPLSHRMSKQDESDGSRKAELIGESRIAGAINCLILKLMNYSGCVRLSAFEDKYGKI